MVAGTVTIGIGSAFLPVFRFSDDRLVRSGFGAGGYELIAVGKLENQKKTM